MIVNVINQNGVDAGEIDVRDDIFGVPEKSALVHQVMVGQLANKRQGTAKTKNRSEVSVVVRNQGRRNIPVVPGKGPSGLQFGLVVAARSARPQEVTGKIHQRK